MKPVIFGMSGLELSEAERAFFAATQPFGFILFARNIELPAQVKALVTSLRDATGREHLPILIDQEGGRVARLKPPHWKERPAAKCFATLAIREGMARAALATKLNARLIAAELHALGITVNCAPVADLPVPGSHAIIGDRAFGEEPAQVIALALAQAEGLAEGGVLPVLKHIPGHGRANADSHEALPTVTAALADLERTDFVPFKALSHLPMAMTAHVRYTALDADVCATLSPIVIAYIRKTLGFDGLLMTDDLSMKALTGDFAARTAASLNAGCDIVLHCNGEMAEMQAVASALPILSGQAQHRAQRVLSLLEAPPVPFDTATAQAALDRYLAAEVA